MSVREEIEAKIRSEETSLDMETLSTLIEYQPTLIKDLARFYGETLREFKSDLQSGILPTLEAYFAVRK